ncbi:MAG TPA: recombinase family protein [Kiritimatiellia bacterium]|nr:recombinase family protein [Kiritimatiellia bacterium]
MAQEPPAWFGRKPTHERRAVAYYRHSAQDRQENSVEIQQDQVRKFAADHHIEILKEFEDRGKSGLSAEGRDGFNQMIHDYVEGGAEDFTYVLVLDVSRWGRFQDTDLSAYYTGLCRLYGKQVVFTSIGFPKDDDLLHGLHLSIERYRAASYSRELSTKVFKGCVKVIQQGFRAGGPPPYGFQRLLLDEQKRPVQVLNRGQRKSIQNQRVTLTPGAPEEVDVVRRIFTAYAVDRRTPDEIAAALNQAGILSPGKSQWSGSQVSSILRNEAYAGTLVYNKTTQRLKSPTRRNPKDEWIRTEDAFDPVVEVELFRHAQEILEAEENARRRRYSAEDMLQRLRVIFERYGAINSRVVSAQSDMVSPFTYRQRFRSLDGAYQALHQEAIDLRRKQIGDQLRSLSSDVQDFGDFLVLCNYMSVAIQPIVPVPCGYEVYWPFRPDMRQEVDLTIGVPLSCADAFEVLGYLLFPRLLLNGHHIRIASSDQDKLAIYAHSLTDLIQDLLRSDHHE